MDEIFDIENLDLRMLGYYNSLDQTIHPEAKYTMHAEKLADLLADTFASINRKDLTEELASALDNGVFIMRDKNSQLYAFQPKTKTAKITDVVYSPENLTVLPSGFKTWFKPGDSFIIDENIGKGVVSQRTTFFEFIRSIYNKGQKVSISAPYIPNGPLVGEIEAVGRDFLSIKGNDSKISLVTNGMYVSLYDPSSQVGKRIGTKIELDEDNVDLSPLGTITNIWEDSQLGKIKSTNGGELGLRLNQLLEPNLKVGQKVVYSTKAEASMTQAIYVHSASTVKDALDLAKRLKNAKRNTEANHVLQHILDEYPDNEEAQRMSTATGYVANKEKEKDEDTKKYDEARLILLEGKGDKEAAIRTILNLIERGKKVKDGIPTIAAAYYVMFSQSEDPDVKSVYSTTLISFIEQYHAMLSPSGSLNFRLSYYNKLGRDDKLFETINSVLQNSNTTNTLRSRMLYFKANKLIEIGDLTNVKDLLSESLYLNPLNNKNYTADQLLTGDVNNGGIEFMPVNIDPYLSSLLTINTNSKYKNNNLNELQDQLNTLSKNSPELMELLLAAASIAHKEAKVPNADKDKKDLVCAYLAEYLSLRAQSAIESGKKESAFFLWKKAFSLIGGFGFFVRWNFACYLSAILNVSPLKNDKISTFAPWQNRKDWKELLAQIPIDAMPWQRIFYTISPNRNLTEEFISYILGHEELRNSLNKSLIEAGTIEIRPLDDLSTVVPKVIELGNKVVEEQATSCFIEAIKHKKVLAEKYDALMAIIISTPPISSLGDIDQELLSIFYKNCMSSLNGYLMEKNPIERQIKNEAVSQEFKNLENEIEKTPTSFSVKCLLPIKKNILKSLEKQQIRVETDSPPELHIQVISDNILVNKDRWCEVMLEISNIAGAMPASNLTLNLISKKLEECVNNPLVLEDILEGGEKKSIKFKIRLGKDAVMSTNWTFAIDCSYHFRGNIERQIFNPLQVHLKAPQKTFTEIEQNPYTYGPALSMDDPTFYGRTKDIDYLIKFVLHPQRTGAQMIVYGQKRCGKSTLVEAVQTTLQTHYSTEAWCVYFTLKIEKQKKNAYYSEAQFYRSILVAINSSLLIVPASNRPELVVPSEEEMQTSSSPTEIFCSAIQQFKLSMLKTEGWERRRLVVIIDEFTVLYNSIKKGVTDENILHHWKGIQESKETNFATIFVGHDITPTFFAENYAKNSTDIIESYLLTYLEEKDARDLIEKPIWDDVNNQSRFEKAAVDWILKYTACSPSYIQIFMQKMVDYINEKEIITITDQDVFIVAGKFINKEYDTFYSIKNFDNLINSGLEDPFCKIKDKEFETVLRAIAKGSYGIDWCPRFRLNTVSKDIKSNIDDVLKDLEDRKVIMRRNNNKLIKIKVGLFKEWLIKN